MNYALLRVLFWLPLIFLVSYLVAGAILAFVGLLIGILWPWIIGAVVIAVAFILLAAKAS